MSATPEPARLVRRRFVDFGGFTLVEVLVAFVVLATLLSVMFRGVVGMRAGADAFNDHTNRELVARGVLEDALVNHALANGTYSGRRDGLRWSLVARPVDLSGQLPGPAERRKADSQGTSANAPPGQVSQSSAGAASANGAGAKTKEEPVWRPQRLKVRVEGSGRPLEIETIRLVKVK